MASMPNSANKPASTFDRFINCYQTGGQAPTLLGSAYAGLGRAGSIPFACALFMSRPTRFFRLTAGQLARRVFPIFAMLLPGLSAPAQTPSPLPQLGRARLAEVVAALTPAEKSQRVLGMGMKDSGFPNGQAPPAGRKGMIE